MAKGRPKKKPGRKGGESKTSPRLIKAKIQRARAIELRTLGWTYQAIADEVGYASPGAACNAVTIEMKSIAREKAEELLSLELERLDKRERHLWSMLAAVEDEPERAKFAGDEAAYLKARNDWATTRVKIDAGLDRVAVRRAKMLGLDAPKKEEKTIQGPQGGPIQTIDLSKMPTEELDALIARLEAEERSEG